MSHAPAPWNVEFSGKPGGNGDLNMYVVDKDGRKIAAVWGKRGEKEATACVVSMSPNLLAACEGLLQCLEQHERLGHVKPDPRWDAARLAVNAARPVTP
jgi:hypothetical protein